MIKKKNIDINYFISYINVFNDIKKPIKCISNYKAQDLRDICKKLDINIMKTPTKYKIKKDLYMLLCQKVM